ARRHRVDDPHLHSHGRSTGLHRRLADRGDFCAAVSRDRRDNLFFGYLQLSSFIRNGVLCGCAPPRPGGGFSNAARFCAAVHFHPKPAEGLRGFDREGRAFGSGASGGTGASATDRSRSKRTRGIEETPCRPVLMHRGTSLSMTNTQTNHVRYLILLTQFIASTF